MAVEEMLVLVLSPLFTAVLKKLATRLGWNLSGLTLSINGIFAIGIWLVIWYVDGMITPWRLVVEEAFKYAFGSSAAVGAAQWGARLKEPQKKGVNLAR